VKAFGAGKVLLFVQKCSACQPTTNPSIVYYVFLARLLALSGAQ
ncbi:uncharacterized protein METZ01_LOCUS343814, partial [marine metagenome]